MFRGFKGDRRLVQAPCLPVGPGVNAVAGVSGNSVDEFVMAEILGGLVGIAAANARGTQQGQANHVVARFVGAVLAIGQDGGAEGSAVGRSMVPMSQL